MALDMTVDQQAVDLLRKAEAILNDGGEHWTKGQMRLRTSHFHPEQKYCAMGALYQAAGAYDNYIDKGMNVPDKLRTVIKRATEMLAKQIDQYSYRDNESTVIDFNDNPATNWEMVRSKFRAAIKATKKQ